MRLTILICTSNRASLLERALDSLNRAERPHGAKIDIVVIANACIDDTHALLSRYEESARTGNKLPLRWASEPTPGKSYALNRAIPLIQGDVVGFVDDDHRVDVGYLSGIHRAACSHPDATLFCGRIFPDWDGSEPAWVHETGPYRIYPLPIPRYDGGGEPKPISVDGPLPGGGNLFLRRAVFDRVGGFAVELGPHGHDLGGGEDSDFVTRCLKSSERLQYVPWVTQYHYVDPARLRLRYLLHKGFQRSRSGIRVQSSTRAGIPMYMWRKLASYLILAIFSFNWPRTRFYSVRLASALGELRGFFDKPDVASSTDVPGSRSIDLTEPARWLAVPLLLVAFAIILPSRHLGASLPAILWVTLLCTAGLVLKSLYDFSQTGPQLADELRRYYRVYSLRALTRLALWSLALCAAMALVGVLLLTSVAIITEGQVHLGAAIAAAVMGVLILTGLQFCRHLLFVPGSVAASYHYRKSRLYPLWRELTPKRLLTVQAVLGVAAVGLFAGCALRLITAGESLLGVAFALLALAGALGGLALSRSAIPRVTAGNALRFPNILMIGSDTLRADRLGAACYRRNLTPFIDSLAARGSQFTACYVPCARTAPSLISMLTGTWPHNHGIRDNFVSEEGTRLATPALASILAQQGYRTAAVSDWCGGDLGKFPLGFEILDLPKDQWNIKYLLRQGPKDIRLFLSLFTHNRFGKRFLPELYYLAGVPLTSLVGRDARALISQFAAKSQPFFMNVFVSTTHPPFGSEYPNYTRYTNPEYTGESKFVMARLTDPWEIIRRQGDSKKEFDLEQIIDLYDGCVSNFDGEVMHIIEHLRVCGLVDSTIIVIYSDHGMEFFEHETWGQGNSVRGDFSALVPLVIVDPRLKKTVVCPHIVRSIDIAPTLLDLVGIARPAAMDGVSLVPYLKGESVNLDLAAYNETGIWLTDLPGMAPNHLRYPSLLDLLEIPDKQAGTLSIKPEYRHIIIEAKDRMIRLGPWKLTYQPTTDGALYALYNVAEDPECRYNLTAQHPEIVGALRVRLLDWIGAGSRLDPIEPGAAVMASVQA